MSYKKTYKNIKIAVIFVLVLLGVLFVLEKKGITNFYHKNVQHAEQQEPAPTINYSPPTENEKQQADNQKQTNQETQASSSTLPDTASVVIVDASQYDTGIEVRAFVSNVIEDGTCEIMFTNNGLSFTKNVPAYGDASTTPCIALTVPRSEFAEAGSWQVKVTYKNDKLTGSATTTLEVK